MALLTAQGLDGRTLDEEFEPGGILFDAGILRQARFKPAPRLTDRAAVVRQRPSIADATPGLFRVHQPRRFQDPLVPGTRRNRQIEQLGEHGSHTISDRAAPGGYAAAVDHPAPWFGKRSVAAILSPKPREVATSARAG